MENKLDIVICITSYNRFDMAKRLIDQLLTQNTQVKFKIILADDGSSDLRYSEFETYSDKLTYVRKEKNTGKAGYYQTMNLLWAEAKKYDTKFLLQTDDDFVICFNFLDTLMTSYENAKEVYTRLTVLCPHLYSFNKNISEDKYYRIQHSVDGIALIDISVIKSMNYLVPKPIKDVNHVGMSVGFWQLLDDAGKHNDGQVLRLYKSLVYHDNTNGSVMHGAFRNSKVIFTENFEGVVPFDILEFNDNIIVEEKKQTNNKTVELPLSLKEQRKLEKDRARQRSAEYELKKQKDKEELEKRLQAQQQSAEQNKNVQNQMRRAKALKKRSL
jgi:glycosyltransferase involved in cell wall biosynthesis